MLKIMIDTCVILYAFQTKKECVKKNIKFIKDSKKIVEYIKQGKIQVSIPTRAKSELNKWKNSLEYDVKNMFDFIESLEVKSSISRYDYSSYDEDCMMSDSSIEMNNKIEDLIKRKKSKNDTDILHSASTHSIDCLVTTNEKDFIKKDDTRKKLEDKSGVLIFRPSEFLEFYDLID